ncbi:MAG: DUF2786 domain-containing protein [Dehalococcoidia bacterium]
MSADEAKLDRMRGLVAALLSKTTANGCTEAEASSALEKAQELLLRYNLSLQDVRAKADGDAGLRDRVGRVDIDVAAGFQWRAKLLAGLAQANLCRIVLSDEGDRGELHIFGTQANIRVVLDMWHWICEQLERMGAQSLRDYMQPTQQGGWTFHPDGTVSAKPWTPKGDEDEWVYLAGFYSGAVARISDRVKSAFERFSRESDQTRALVVTSGREVGEAVQRAFPRLGSWRGGRTVGRDGLRDGRKAGDRVRLTRDAAIAAAGGARLHVGAGR